MKIKDKHGKLIFEGKCNVWIGRVESQILTGTPNYVSSTGLCSVVRFC